MIKNSLFGFSKCSTIWQPILFLIKIDYSGLDRKVRKRYLRLANRMVHFDWYKNPTFSSDSVWEMIQEILKMITGWANPLSGIDKAEVCLAGARLQQQTLPRSAYPACNAIDSQDTSWASCPGFRQLPGHEAQSTTCTKIQRDNSKAHGISEEAAHWWGKHLLISIRVFRHPKEQKQAASDPALADSWQISPVTPSLANYHVLWFCFQAVQVTRNPCCREKQDHLLLSPSSDAAKDAEMEQERSWFLSMQKGRSP